MGTLLSLLLLVVVSSWKSLLNLATGHIGHVAPHVNVPSVVAEAHPCAAGAHAFCHGVLELLHPTPALSGCIPSCINLYMYIYIYM